MRKFLKFIFIILILFVIFFSIFILNYLHLIPQKTYSNKDFNIIAYKSNYDTDNDGIDDQTDILNSARSYVETKPKYMSKYYSTGYPNDEYGVCTDVVAFALLNSGYDLMSLVNRDILENKNRYNITTVDKNIDFRRVKNLKVYFDNHAISLTTDINQIVEWQGGDIVVFSNHIGIVSDIRNKDGITYIIHNAGQPIYEEDAIKHFNIVGHYRIVPVK